MNPLLYCRLLRNGSLHLKKKIKMKPTYKSKTKETIQTGIGRFSGGDRRAMGVESTLEFLEMYCIYPELSHDIRNSMSVLIDRHKRTPMLQRRQTYDRAISVFCEMVESHKVVRVNIISHLAPTGTDKWLRNYSKVGTVYLRITNDGLIADIIDNEDVPSYNPGNLVTIYNEMVAQMH